MSLSSKKAASPAIPQLAFIFITILIDKMGESIIFPILPFLIERFSTDAFTLGLLVSSFSVAQFIAAPIIGALSDRYGRRPVLLVCILGTTASYYLFGFANTLVLIFVSRIIDGITGGVAGTAQAYIADISAPQDRAKNFGLTGAAFGLGFTLGPALGGILANVSLNLPVFVAGTLALINFGIGFFSLPESLPLEQRRPLKWRDLNPITQLTDLLANVRIRGLLTAFFLFNFAFAGFSGIFVLFLNQRFGWGPSEAAMVFFFIGVVSTIVQGGLIRKLLPAFGEAKLSISGLLLVAIAFAIIVLLPDQGWMVVPGIYTTQAMLALGVGLIIPCLRGLISNRVSNQDQGRTIGGSQGVQSLASILGPLWAGYVFDNLGLLSPFWMGALIMIVAANITFLNLVRQKK